MAPTRGMPPLSPRLPGQQDRSRSICRTVLSKRRLGSNVFIFFTTYSVNPTPDSLLALRRLGHMHPDRARRRFAGTAFATAPPFVVRVHRSVPADRQGVCTGVLVMKDVVATTAECTLHDARYVSTLPVVSDSAIRGRECSDHIRIDHTVTHECYVDSEHKRPYDAALCDLISGPRYAELDFGRVPDDPHSSVRFGIEGYNIGLIFLSEPRVLGSSQRPRRGPSSLVRRLHALLQFARGPRHQRPDLQF